MRGRLIAGSFAAALAAFACASQPPKNPVMQMLDRLEAEGPLPDVYASPAPLNIDDPLLKVFSARAADFRDAEMRLIAMSDQDLDTVFDGRTVERIGAIVSNSAFQSDQGVMNWVIGWLELAGPYAVTALPSVVSALESLEAANPNFQVSETPTIMIGPPPLSYDLCRVMGALTRARDEASSLVPARYAFCTKRETDVGMLRDDFEQRVNARLQRWPDRL